MAVPGCWFGLRGAALREPPGVANEQEGAEQGPADTKDQQEDRKNNRPPAATGARIYSHGVADAMWDRERGCAPGPKEHWQQRRMVQAMALRCDVSFSRTALRRRVTPS